MVGTVDTWDLRQHLDGAGALLAASANVIMQLSRLPVGHGVVESRVESGQLTRHPLKRTRTTLTYLAVALLGSDRERALFRAAVDRSHAKVRSGPDSPVAYSAFDPELQKWVAACLYYGAQDVHTRLHGPMSDLDADRFYEEASRLATTLQVDRTEWPADRREFDEYWSRSLDLVSMDDTVRDYLWGVVRLTFLPPPLRFGAGLNQFVTAGFLPPVFRDLMGIPWTDLDERRFGLFLSALSAAYRPMPVAMRSFPLNFFLWEMRGRVATGLPLV